MALIFDFLRPLIQLGFGRGWFLGGLLTLVLIGDAVVSVVWAVSAGLAATVAITVLVSAVVGRWTVDGAGESSS